MHVFNHIGGESMANWAEDQTHVHEASQRKGAHDEIGWCPIQSHHERDNSEWKENKRVMLTRQDPSRNYVDDSITYCSIPNSAILVLLVPGRLVIFWCHKCSPERESRGWHCVCVWVG